MDYVLFDGDEIAFPSKFGDAEVEGPKRAALKGSGRLSCNGRKACIDGDEKDWSVFARCKYTTRKFAEAGEGTIKVLPLPKAHFAKSATDGGKAVLLLGDKFAVVFEVQKPAQERVRGKEEGEKDTTKRYEGQARFLSTQRGMEAM